MAYKYYNQFNLSNDLAQAISHIISEVENGNYLCKNLIVTIPEHKGLVFKSPLTQEEICRPGAMALSGAQINAINEEYGRYVEGTIPEEEYSYLVIIEEESDKEFSKLSFKTKDEIDLALSLLTVTTQEYCGVFDSRTLCEIFPYLEVFFKHIDAWRAETGRVTIDDDVLKSAINAALLQKQLVQNK